MRFGFIGSHTTVDAFSVKLERESTLIFDGIDKGVPDRISFTVSSEDDWAAHMTMVDELIERECVIINWALKMDVSISIDIAIEPEDVNGLVSSFCFPGSILKKLTANEIEVTFSVYK